MSNNTNYEPTVVYKDDAYALNAIHIHKKKPSGYAILELKKPDNDREEMKKIILYANDDLTLDVATHMAVEYATEENEENGNRYQWVFLPECDK